MELIKYDEQTKVALFNYHSDSEIAKLPTMTRLGEGDLRHIGYVSEGSKAINDVEYKMYSLTADDEWVEYELNSGGGGGSSEAVDINYDNTESGLDATNVQNAIDEIAENIPTKTSDLVNNSNFASDANYVHTDNNYTNTDKAAVDNAILKTSQTLTDSEKAQARTNLGAASQTDISSPYNFKGSVSTSADLPSSGNVINDTYYITNEMVKKTWNGSAWYQSSLNEDDYDEVVGELKQDLTQLDADVTALTTVVNGKANQSDLTSLTIRVGVLETNAVSLDRRVTNLEYASRGVLYREETNTTAAYSKALDADVMPWGQLTTIGGKSVVWNQLFNKIDRTLSRGVIYTYDSTNRKVTVDDTDWDGVNSSSYSFNNDTNLLVKGHKYIALSSETVPVGITYWDGSTYPFISINSIFTANGSDGFSASLSFRITSSSYIQVGSPYSFDFYLVDLTQMYGAGNEPTTTSDPRIAEIEAYATLHPEYNSGEIVSAKVDKVVSTSASDVLIAEYPIPSEVQALDGYGWSAKGVYNYVDFVEKKYHKKVGRVDLGTLTWEKSSRNYFYANYVTGLPLTTSYGKNVICSKYEQVAGATVYNVTANGFTVNNTYISATDERIYISDTTKVDATPAEMKAALNGVYLYYELAEEVVTDISAYLGDNAINVEGGGKLTFHQNGTEFVVPNSENFLIKTGG